MNNINYFTGATKGFELTINYENNMNFIQVIILIINTFIQVMVQNKYVN